jgi:hypothetical protein
LRELQAKISDAPALSQDDKDEIAVAVLQQIKALKQASDEANGLKPGSAAPENAVHAIEDSRERTVVAAFAWRSRQCRRGVRSAASTSIMRAM